MNRNFFFEQSEADGQKIIVVAASDISIPGFSGAGSGGSPVNIQDARGVLVILGGIWMIYPSSKPD